MENTKFLLDEFVVFGTSATNFLCLEFYFTFIFVLFVSFLSNQNWSVRLFGEILYTFIEVSFGL